MVRRQRSALEAPQEPKENVRLKKTLRWLPLALAGVLCASGGVAVATASMGHEADVAEMKSLVEKRLTEADTAEEELRQAVDGLLAQASTVKPDRYATDVASIEAYVADEVADRGAKVESTFVAFVGKTGSMQSYQVTAATNKGTALLIVAVSSTGDIESVSISWADGAPERSDP